MKSSYINWFNVEFSHNYFNGDKYVQLELQPFVESARAMKNYQIMQSKNENTVDFFVSSEPDNLKNQVNGLQQLNFQVINKDLLFFNYTDLPFLQEGELFYFQNQSNDKLQLGQYVSTKDLVIAHKKTVNLSLSASDISIEVKLKSGETVLSASSEGIQNFNLNLSSLEDGVYELWIDQQLNKTIFISNVEMNATCMGILSINIGNLMGNYPATKTLNLNFNAQSSFFEYQVIVPPNRKIDIKELSIYSSEGEQFEGPIKKEVIGKQLANSFTSKASVQLQNEPKLSAEMELVYANKFSNRNNQLKRKLPYPSIEGLKKYRTENGQEDYLLTTIVYV